MEKVTPCLWFYKNAEEAIDFYMSVFKDGRIISKVMYEDTNEHAMPGEPMFIEFELKGQRYRAINAKDKFPFTYAVSFMVNCEDQKEVDYYYDKLREGGGKEIECGWVEDKFGLPWQVVPKRYLELVQNPATSAAVQKAMMKMKKLNVAELEAAVKADKKAA